MRMKPYGWLLLNFAVLLVFTAFAPLEKTLGANIRLVYLHGAWVWAGLAAFAAAAIAGLVYLFLRPAGFIRWCESLAWTGMILWLTYLPMSLVVMQMNWGGFFFDEPRWRIPMTYAVVGVLLQIGLLLVRKPVLSAAGNLIFGAALWWSTINMRSILHPESPVFQSNSVYIQLYFSGLLFLMFCLGFQITLLLAKSQKHFSQDPISG
jgi:hypothetical protein